MPFFLSPHLTSLLFSSHLSSRRPRRTLNVEMKFLVPPQVFNAANSYHKNSNIFFAAATEGEEKMLNSKSFMTQEISFYNPIC